MEAIYEDLRDITTVAMGLLAIVLTVSVWIRTKSFAPTVGALLVGCLALLGVANPDTISEIVYREARSRLEECTDTSDRGDESVLVERGDAESRRRTCTGGAPPSSGQSNRLSSEDECADSNRACGYSPNTLCDGDWAATGRCWGSDD